MVPRLPGSADEGAKGGVALQRCRRPRPPLGVLPKTERLQPFRDLLHGGAAPNQIASTDL
jgi:hypothetical protein